MSVPDITEFLKALSLPNGAVLKEVSYELQPDGRIKFNGKVSAGGGNSTFSATVTAAGGKLQSSNLHINPALRHRPFIGTVKQQLENLDSLMRNEINKKINPAWEASHFQIQGQFINLEFSKKS